MKLKWQVAGMLALGGSLTAAAAAPVLRVVEGSAGGTNRLHNADFEERQGERFPSWSAAPEGYLAAPGEGRGSSVALGCAAPDRSGWRGASQNLVLNQPTAAPFKVSGWSRAEGVDGGRDSGYSLYVDLLYTDGTPLWGQTANFSTGTHDWERRAVLILPEKPVKSLTLHCLFRGHAGRAWFDDVGVREVVAA
ncbi:MAG TPA: hypothetical protein VKA04_05315, partial [Pseudodesulfovibrio sp.]|nr:hypothetical protein [Pseudodesulfovibrio sp.]